jgi:hypothetical protein
MEWILVLQVLPCPGVRNITWRLESTSAHAPAIVDGIWRVIKAREEKTLLVDGEMVPLLCAPSAT